MSIGRTLAEAVVRIIPDTSLFGARLRESLAKDMAGAGRESGKQYGGGFENVAEQGIAAFRRKAGADFADVAEDWGNNSGTTYHRSFFGRFLDHWRGSLRGEFHKTTEEETSSIGQTVGTTFGRSMADHTVFSLVNIFRGKFAADAIPVIIAVIAAIGPFVGTAIVAAIVTSIGLGGIAAAVALQFNNPAVKEAIQGIGSDFLGIMKNITGGFAQPIADGLQIMRATMNLVLPELQSGFNALSGSVVPLSRGIAGFFAAVTLGFKSVLEKSAPLVTAFGNELPGFGKALEKFLSLLAGTPGQILALHGLFVILNGVIIGLGYAFNALGHAFVAQVKAFEAIINFFRGTSWEAKLFHLIIKQIEVAWGRLEGAFKSFLTAVHPIIPLLEKLGIILGAVVLGAILGAVILAIYSIALAFKVLAIVINVIVHNVIPALVTAFFWVKNAVHDVWIAMQDAWNKITNLAVAVWHNLYNNLIGPLIWFFGTKIPNIIQDFWIAIQAAWNAIVNIAVATWHGIYNHLVSPIIRFFTQDVPEAAHIVWDKITGYWDAIVNAAVATWHGIWNHLIAPIIRFFTQDTPTAARIVWEKVTGYWNTLVNDLHRLWNWVHDNVFEKIVNVITKDIPSAFHQGVKAIGQWWDTLKGIVAKPINFVLKTVLEDGILGAIRWIASKVGVNFDVHVKTIPGFAGGGLIRGPGTGTSDSIVGINDHGIPTARVSNNEFVVNAAATKKHLALLHAINSMSLPGFSIGGLVGNVGGWFSNVAGDIGHAVSGLGKHAIELITDPAKFLLGDLTKLLGGVPGGGVAKDLPSGAAKTSGSWLVDWIKSHITKFFSQSSADIMGIQQWLKTHVDGLPYTWGAVGPNTFDCSGLVGEVIARALHMPSYQRYFVTGDEASFLSSHGFHRGKDGDLVVGFSDVHTMGMIGGLPFEAGSTPIHVGSGTSDVFSFPQVWAIKLAQSAGAAGSVPAGGAQELARSLLPSWGWSDAEWGPLQALWNRESGWNPNAVNPSSGAYGIPQALGQGHPFNLGDAAAQVRWGLEYISSRYGSPSAAWAHEQAVNWYSRGGLVQSYDKGGPWPNNTVGVNTSGHTEHVSSHASMEEVCRLLEELIDAMHQVGGDVAAAQRVAGQSSLVRARRA